MIHHLASPQAIYALIALASLALVTFDAWAERRHKERGL